MGILDIFGKIWDELRYVEPLEPEREASPVLSHLREEAKIRHARYGFYDATRHYVPLTDRIIWRKRLPNNETLKVCIRRKLRNKQTREAILAYVLSFAPPLQQKRLEGKIRSSIRVEASRLKP